VELGEVALAHAQTPAERASVEAKLKRVRELAEFAKQEGVKAVEISEAVDRKFEAQQAYFARTQVLDFIRSRRRSLTPIKFAEAIAGLPFMGWRQSAERCARLAPEQRLRIADMNYEVFRVLERILRRRERDVTPRDAIFSAIERLSSADAMVKGHLMENLDALGAATAECFGSPVRGAELPYRLTALFVRLRSQPQTAVTRFLRE
jgi:hypothetical protein